MNVYYDIISVLSIFSTTITNIIIKFLQIFALFLLNRAFTYHKKWYIVGMRVVVERTNKRLVQIKVQKDCVVVFAPWYMHIEKVRQTVSENLAWIKQKQQEFVAQRDAKSNAESQDKSQNVLSISKVFQGMQVLVGGEIFEVKPTLENKTFCKDNVVFVNKDAFDCKDGRLKALKSYLKRIGANYLSTEISAFGSKYSLCPKKIEIKQLETWLRCCEPTNRFVCLDFRVVQLPMDLQQYVIAHAFSHFFRLGHGADFASVMENFIPHNKDIQQRLADYDFLLSV